MPTATRRRLLLFPKRSALVFPAISGLQARYVASDLALSDGAAVSTWLDLSGNGRHATQATGANQPTFRTNVLNGKPVVRFDGSNDLLKTAAFAMTQPITVIVVGKAGASAGNQYFIDGAVTGNTLVVYEASTGTHNLFAGAVLTGPAADDAFHTFVGLFNGASSKIRRDGGAGTSGNAGTGAPNGLTLGSHPTPGTSVLNGDLAEALVYAGSVSVTDINALGAYLAQQYGLTWTTAT